MAGSTGAAEGSRAAGEQRESEEGQTGDNRQQVRDEMRFKVKTDVSSDRQRACLFQPGPLSYGSYHTTMAGTWTAAQKGRPARTFRFARSTVVKLLQLRARTPAFGAPPAHAIPRLEGFAAGSLKLMHLCSLKPQSNC